MAGVFSPEKIKKWLVLLLIPAVVIMGYIWKNSASFSETASTPYPQQVFEQHRGKQPLLLEFVSDSCIYCIRMKPVIAALDREYGDKVRFIIANVSQGEEAAELAYSFRVQGVPTVIIFSQEGEETVRIVGYQKRDIIEKELKQVAQ